MHDKKKKDVRVGGETRALWVFVAEGEGQTETW